MGTMKREALYFVALFVLPCLMFIGLELSLTESLLPPLQRLYAFEDMCPYGYCYFFPGFVYVGSRLLVLVLP
jgi:hypothetical protein